MRSARACAYRANRALVEKFMSFISDTIAEAIDGLFEVVRGETDEICQDTKGYTVSSWTEWQYIKAGSTGGIAAIIPGLWYVTLPADVAILFRIMHRCAIGTVYLKTGYADQDAFAGALATWAGAVSLDEGLSKQVVAKSLAAGAKAVGGPVGLKLAIKGFSVCAGVIVAEKLGPQISQKLVAKVSTKLGAKATTSWIPIISGLVGLGANLWIIDDLTTAAIEYADFIIRVQRSIKTASDRELVGLDEDWCPEDEVEALDPA